MRKLFLAFSLTAIANEPLEHVKFYMEVDDKDTCKLCMKYCQQLQTWRRGETLTSYPSNVT